MVSAVQVVDAEGLRKKASEIELEAADFLDASGNRPEDKTLVVKAVFRFIDGARLEVPASEFDAINDISFSLRPASNDG